MGPLCPTSTKVQRVTRPRDRGTRGDLPISLQLSAEV